MMRDLLILTKKAKKKKKKEEKEVEIVVSKRVMLSKKLKMMKFYYHSLFVLSSANEYLTTNVPGFKEEFNDFLRKLHNTNEESKDFSRNVEESDENSDGDGESVFKREDEEEYLSKMGYKDSDFEVENFEDLKGKIGELVLARGREIKREREDGGKRSFMERLKESSGNGPNGDNESSFKGIWKSSIEEIKGMAIGVGVLLSLYCSDFLFVVSENEDKVGQYRKCLKCLLKLLISKREDEWSGVAIKKVLSVLEFAERKLVKTGKLKLETLDDHDQEIYADDEDDPKEILSREREIDQVLEMLLKEVVCLDSVLSYPILGDVQMFDKSMLNWQLSNLKEALGEGKKEMETIGSKVHHLKTLQDELIEDGTNLTMTKFREVMDAKIIETWCQPDVDQPKDDPSS
ncbi:hypothetical protein TIFTF001_012562 [Ficus carica]|uniref:Uncharacterized protein n=1 Tax=Ficus carica TaxID=3494 RepID=A0AA88D1X8_FICCA|nr:hypothetical protein TIFTF001_012562 [Ficus carica]